MDPQLKKGLLDACVLASIAHEDAYGYRVTQDAVALLGVSESALYPVLRRLQKDGCLEVYDREFAGRNRRYYKLTETGDSQLRLYQSEWRSYSSKISGILASGGRKL